MSAGARRALLLAALLIAAAAGAAALLYRLDEEALLVVSSAEGRVLAELALPDGRFDYVFTHSLHLTPVRERYRVEAGGGGKARLRLYELRYQSAGAGMPEDAELGYRLEDGVFVLAMDRSFERIPLLVSIVEGHGVEIGGALRPFTEWAAPKRGLILSGKIVKVLRPRR
jgi:hypothetical protein